MYLVKGLQASVIVAWGPKVEISYMVEWGIWDDIVGHWQKACLFFILDYCLHKWISTTVYVWTKILYVYVSRKQFVCQCSNTLDNGRQNGLYSICQKAVPGIQIQAFLLRWILDSIVEICLIDRYNDSCW